MSPASATRPFTLDADPGITLLGQTSGENAFVYDGKAFENAAVNTQAWDQHRGVQVVADGEVPSRWREPCSSPGARGPQARRS